MRVILKENVVNLGRVGDVVNVRDGYARNFLLPRNLVIPADSGSIKLVEHYKKGLEKKRLAAKSSSEELLQKVLTLDILVRRKVGEGERLFGSVNPSDVVEAISQKGYEIPRGAIRMETIKQLGTYPVTIRLAADVEGEIQIKVLKEN